MRQLWTTDDVRATPDALRWAVEKGRVQRVGRGVFAAGAEPVTRLDMARADVLRCGGEARGHLAGVLHGLDSVWLRGRPVRRDRLPEDRIVVVEGIRCADGLTTLMDLAGSLDDLTWEQALESALRKRLTTVTAIESAAARIPGTARIRRVLNLRYPGAPATESLLETLCVQLARPVIGDLVRQHEVRDPYGNFVARVDLARPTQFFLELDGEGHAGQPEYDAVRQTNVVTVTGMLVGRFTWTEVTRRPRSTQRRLANLAATAAAIRRPSP